MTKYWLIVFLSIANLASGQSGVEFWFAAPEVTSGHDDKPVYLRVSTGNQPAGVSVNLPADQGFIPLTANVAANSSYTFDLTPLLATIECANYNTPTDNGIQVLSSDTISAYYEVGARNNTDIFSLKANNALGERFFVSAQSFWSSGGYSPPPRSTASIVATQDSTSITITPTSNIAGHAANTPFTILLQKGQTYTIAAAGAAVNNRFGGTSIVSDKPIAVTISDDSIKNNDYGGCRDIIGDQTIPLEKIGREYVITRGFLYRRLWGWAIVNPDRVYIMATRNNTDVFLDGSPTPVASLQAGQTYEAVLSNNSLYIQSSDPVYVMHVSGFGCEVGMAIVPSVECTGSKNVSFTRSQTGDFYLIAMIENGSEGDFTINGDPNLLQASDFNVVPGTNGNWVYARKAFNNGTIQVGQNYRVSNPEKFHMGIINGGPSTGCLYGYFSDFGAVNTGPIFHY